ncbi:MAG: TIGR01459 family HAD-type hydrolase [Pseudomonadota bacterium]
MSYTSTWSAEDAFQRYEEVRFRFPEARFPGASQACVGLGEVADHVDAFILDSFGVLNVGDKAILGAIQRMAELRARGKRLVVLTNAASYTHQKAMERYARLGFDFEPDEVVSSRNVCTSRLGDLVSDGDWGAIAAPDDRFSDIPAVTLHWSPRDHANFDGILLLSSADLYDSRFEELQQALLDHPLPVVVANPDLVAPRENGLSKEPGYYAHLLSDKLGLKPVFFGKPFGDAFADAKALLSGIPSERIAMVGDTLHTDILGGAAAGMRTVLVKDHGLFAGLDAEAYVARSGIRPDFMTATV